MPKTLKEKLERDVRLVRLHDETIAASLAQTGLVDIDAQEAVEDIVHGHILDLDFDLDVFNTPDVFTREEIIEGIAIADRVLAVLNQAGGGDKPAQPQQFIGPTIRIQECPDCENRVSYNTATGEWACMTCNASGWNDYWARMIAKKGVK